MHHQYSALEPAQRTMSAILLILFITVISMEVHGQSWTRIHGLPVEQFVCLAEIDGALYTTGEQRVYRSDDRGATWTALGVVHPDILALGPVARFDGSLYAGTYKSGVWRSTDGGATWFDASEGLAGLGATDVLCFAVRGDSLYAGTGGAGVFVRGVGQTSWKTFSDGLAWNNSYTVYTLGVSNGTLIATAGGNGGVFRRPIGSSRWLDAALPDAPFPGLELVDLHHDGDRLFCAGSRRVFWSEDDGQSWTECPTLFPAATDVRLTTTGSRLHAVVNTLHDGTLLYNSDDQGATWRHGETIGFSYVSDLFAADGRLYAACEDGLRIYNAIPNSVPALDRRNALVIEGFAPHPAHGSTAIVFTLEHPSTAELVLIDASGRIHTVMPARQLPGGTHRWMWNSRGVPPGIYLCRLQTGSAVDTRAIVIAR